MSESSNVKATKRGARKLQRSKSPKPVDTLKPIYGYYGPKIIFTDKFLH